VLVPAARSKKGRALRGTKIARVAFERWKFFTLEMTDEISAAQ
jgi:hypothetical protein